jgi:hypothetical protein
MFTMPFGNIIQTDVVRNLTSVHIKQVGVGGSPIQMVKERKLLDLDSRCWIWIPDAGSGELAFNAVITQSHI